MTLDPTYYGCTTYYGVFLKVLGATASETVGGAEAHRFLARSRLPNDDLEVIWELADGDGDGRFSLDEFCTAMHLVTRRVAGDVLPKELPAVLRPKQPNWEPTAEQRLAFGAAFDQIVGDGGRMAAERARKHMGRAGVRPEVIVKARAPPRASAPATSRTSRTSRTRSLAPSRNILQHLATSRNISQHLATSRRLAHCLAHCLSRDYAAGARAGVAQRWPAVRGAVLPRDGADHARGQGCQAARATPAQAQGADRGRGGDSTWRFRLAAPRRRRGRRGRAAAAEHTAGGGGLA
jgi:hypothetical protein